MRKVLLLHVIFLCIGCGSNDSDDTDTAALDKNKPHQLTYETTSILLNDMKAFSGAVRSLEHSRLKRIDSKYQGVLFLAEEQPLFVNVYPDPAGNAVIFLVAPKDPRTGSNYLIAYDKNLPVTDSDTIELQIRTENPEAPLQCRAQVPDPEAYMKERDTHEYRIIYTLKKSFMQSGTYDFDALTVPSYRTRGYPFIVFDFVKAELKDTTASISTVCK